VLRAKNELKDNSSFSNPFGYQDFMKKYNLNQKIEEENVNSDKNFSNK